MPDNSVLDQALEAVGRDVRAGAARRVPDLGDQVRRGSQAVTRRRRRYGGPALVAAVAVLGGTGSLWWYAPDPATPGTVGVGGPEGAAPGPIPPGPLPTAPVTSPPTTAAPPDTSPVTSVAAPGPTPVRPPTTRPAAPTPSTSRSAPAGASGLVWPMAGPVVDEFGVKDGLPHLGIDIAAPVGTSVSAAGAGVVVEAIKDGGAASGYGNLVVIDHGGGIRTYHAHLSTVQVSAGDRVGQGRVIGAVGMTGSSNAPHLHLEVRVDGQPTDPRDHLPG